MTSDSLRLQAQPYGTMGLTGTWNANRSARSPRRVGSEPPLRAPRNARGRQAETPMTETDDRCPCGTGETFGECCGRYLQDGRVAPTAEALMRSRYTGFATRAVHYLLATWHPSTRPDELELDEDMVWHRLDDGTAIGQRGRLHETSRFVREDGRWLYVDGGIGA